MGQLGHASWVVAPSKTVMCQLFELLAGVQQAHHHNRLNAAFQADLLWWATFLDTWNGVVMIQTSSQQLAHHVWTDDSSHFGCGAVYPTSPSWLQLPRAHPHLQGAVYLQEESICRSFYLSLLLVLCGGPIDGALWW